MCIVQKNCNSTDKQLNEASSHRSRGIEDGSEKIPNALDLKAFQPKGVGRLDRGPIQRRINSNTDIDHYQTQTSAWKFERPVWERNMSRDTDFLSKGPSSELFKVSLAQYACGNWCSCRCHKSFALQTPHFLSRLAGALFVGYNGNPVSRSRCDEHACKGKSGFRARVAYYFPQWFLSWGLMATIAANQQLAVAINVTRVRYTGDNIFMMALDDDLNGIKAQFSQGLGSPNDISHNEHDSLLKVGYSG
jgi:hypothetical protein